MSEEIIKLYPRNYKKVSGKIKIFLKADKVLQDDFNRISEELSECKCLTVTSYKKNASERRYSLYIGRYVLNFLGGDNSNLHCSSVLFGKEAAERKGQLYKTRIFNIIPNGGIYIIYNGEIYPKTVDNSWDMDEATYNDLLDSLEEYFDSDEEETPEQKKERIKISERFKRNIIRPFSDYTDKEEWVEQYKQSQGEGVLYFKREFSKRMNKGSVYNFFSIDENADPENTFFNIGDKITVIDTKNMDRRRYDGVLENIDNESTNSVIYSIAFYHQLNDADMPQSGKLVMGINDTQTKVRNQVIKSIERGEIESAYMYKVFDNFSVGGYEEIPDDLKEYLVEKMADKFPPNQMQLEAIIKGILTEDLLLVLGPPGTGKTTVISFWVEYFIKKGMRVLISSQNNAAVDNVLARFGKMAETVRLGNENKVQENCKPYLPENKIAAMQNHFNENDKRVQSDFEHNEKEIKQYRERLTTYKALIDDYKEKRKKVVSYTAPLSEIMKNLNLLYDKVRSIEHEMDVRFEVRAHKEIFLQVYESKGVIERLLRRRYAKRVREDLEKNSEKLLNLRGEYRSYVDQYNALVISMKNTVGAFREKGLIEPYREVRAKLIAYMGIAMKSDFAPDFYGELTELYKAPAFDNNLKRIVNLIDSEFEKIKKLEEIISKTRGVLAEWIGLVNSNRNDIMQNALLETCQIVGATCIGINSNRMFSKVKFDVAIVDESGQIQIHNALIPMSRARKNLLLGDYKQIPPCANDDVIAACKAEEIDTKLLNMSFFEYAFEEMKKKTIKELESKGMSKSQILKPVLEDYEPGPYKKIAPKVVQNMIYRVIKDPKKLVNLNRQFRMPGNISDIISEWFYEKNYISSYDMSRFAPMVPKTDKPLVVVSTSKASECGESQPENKMGYQNHYEAQLIANMVRDVINSQPEDTREEFINKIEDNIGIISAYGAQVRLIREYLSECKLGIRDNQIRSMVASLDSFQGQERPLILYSLTRSTTYKAPESGRVGFMKELRRLNVAFTRCQKQLVIVGDLDYLAECRHMENDADDWPCANTKEVAYVGQEYINQCAECSAICEKKFARFMRLLMQHVNEGAGNIIESEQLMRKGA
jgi:signal recognition particle GTPase